MHHWEYWIDWRNGQELLCKIPDRYILEMSCDMIGAAKAYGTNSPLSYFLSNKKNYHMESSSLEKLEEYLRIYSE